MLDAGNGLRRVTATRADGHRSGRRSDFAAWAAAAGDAGDRGQLPTWLESLVLVAPVPPRGDPEPDAADLPAARGRLRHPAGGLEAADRAAAPGGASTTRPWRGPSPPTSPASRSWSPTTTLPEGDPPTLPPPPVAPAAAADLPIRWYYYTSGTTADPKGAQHTDASIKAAAVGMCERSR